MELSTWYLFVATEFLFCFSPGPAVVYTVSHSLSGGLRLSLAASSGVICGNIIYFVLSVLGLGVLLATSYHFFLIVKWAGIAYLVFLGISMLFASGAGIANSNAKRKSVAAVVRGGIVLQLANPKNLVFFLAILPPFINPNENIALQILILGLTSQVLEFVALTTYGSFTSYISMKFSRTKIGKKINQIAGVLVIAVALNLSFLDHSTVEH